MNRAQLVAEIARQTRQPRAVVEEVVAALCTEVPARVAAGETVSLVGFAKFVPVDRPARPGRNPATGETIVVPAARAVRVVVSKNFKDTVAGR